MPYASRACVLTFAKNAALFHFMDTMKTKMDSSGKSV